MNIRKRSPMEIVTLSLGSVVGVIAFAFVFGLFFALGVAVASKILPVHVDHAVTYDNLDKPNSHK